MNTLDRVLQIVADRSSASSSEVAAALAVTRQTAHRKLAALVEAGDLVRTGQGRATRYFLSPSAALPGLAAWLDEEAERETSLSDVGDSLRQRLGADNPLDPLAWAFHYMLLDASDERCGPFGPFGPLLEMGGGQYPPPLGDVPSEALLLWEKLSGLVKHPYLRARLGDLLWERRWSDRPYSHAVAAIDAYLEMVPPVADGLECAESLARAGGLARQLSDQTRDRLVIEAALDQAQVELAGLEPAPGIVLRFLSVAIGDRSEDVQRRVGDLLHQAWDVFDDPWIRDKIIGMQLAVSPSDQGQHDQLRRRSVDLWLVKASSESGMRRRLFLAEALERARAYQLRDLANEIRQELQETETDPDEFQTVSSEIEIPASYIENTLTHVSSAGSWSGCLDRLMVLGPLTGSFDQNQETVRQLAQQFPIKRLFHGEVLGPGKVPIFKPRSQADHDELDLSSHERSAIGVGSHIAADALDRVLATHGNPTRAELHTYFTTPFIDTSIAERIAASVEHFTRSRFDECVMVLMPRIEGTIRELLKRIGEPIWWEPQPSRKQSKPAFGQQRTLGKLLDQLKGQDRRRLAPVPLHPPRQPPRPKPSQPLHARTRRPRHTRRCRSPHPHSRVPSRATTSQQPTELRRDDMKPPLYPTVNNGPANPKPGTGSQHPSTETAPAGGLGPSGQGCSPRRGTYSLSDDGDRLSTTYRTDDEPTAGHHLHRRLQPVPRTTGRGSPNLAVAQHCSTRHIHTDIRPASRPHQVLHHSSERKPGQGPPTGSIH